MYQNFDSELPAPTKFLISIYDLSNNINITLIIKTIVILAAVSTIFRSQKIKRILDFLCFYTPKIKEVYGSYLCSQYLRILNLASSCGLNIIKSLEICKDVSQNYIYQDSINEIIKNVSMGEQVNSAMEKSAFFRKEKIICGMIKIGEDAGNIVTVLTKLSILYEEKINHILDIISDIMEPVLIIITSVITGGILISMYLPIFDIGEIIYN